jgi:signal transduction histidine kinase
LGPVGTLVVHSVLIAAEPLGGTLALQLPGFGAQGVWPITFFLTIPLIVVAWQYSFRAVVWYSLGLALIDVAAAAWLLAAGSSEAAWTLLQFSFGRAGVFLANGYLVSRLVDSQRQQRRALAQANRRLVEQASTQEQLAASRERNRLARDLHDTLAHYMSGLVLELEGTRLLWEADSAQAQATLDNAITTARTGLVETRRALQALRATPLADLGFSGAVRELAESMAARNQWQLALELPAVSTVLPPTVEEVLYRIVQEGLTNVQRHAGATAVALSLQMRDGEIRLQIEDNGCGFETRAGATAEQFGLLGMQERSRLIGGDLSITSVPGGGTTVDFVLGYAKAADSQEQAPQQGAVQELDR